MTSHAFLDSRHGKPCIYRLEKWQAMHFSTREMASHALVDSRNCKPCIYRLEKWQDMHLSTRHKNASHTFVDSINDKPCIYRLDKLHVMHLSTRYKNKSWIYRLDKWPMRPCWNLWTEAFRLRVSLLGVSLADFCTKVGQNDAFCICSNCSESWGCPFTSFRLPASYHVEKGGSPQGEAFEVEQKSKLDWKHAVSLPVASTCRLRILVEDARRNFSVHCIRF